MFANNGNEPLDISNITFTNPQFSIDYTTFTIQPGESGELPINFTPSSSGLKQGTMQIFSNDPMNNPYEVQLSGNGIIETNMGWEWIETGFNYILMDIEFPEGQNQVGYSIGQSLTYNGVGIVIKTTDGGSTWTQLTPNGIPGLEAMSFVDMQTGYAAGWDGYVIKTTDGGVTWDTLTVASGMWEINDIEFYDENQGIIIEGPYVYITDDGGETWEAASQLDKGGFNVEYLDQNTLVVGANENYIYKSVDGGYTWQVKNTGIIGELLLGVDFLDANYGMAVGDYGNILTTYDGGESWSVDLQVGDQLLHSVYIWDEDTSWIVGTPELVYKTTDGGIDWNPAFNGNWQKAFYKVTFTDNYTGFICGGSGGIVLRKEGLPEIPEIVVSNNSIVYNPTQVGQSSVETFTISNMGYGNLEITNIASTNSSFTVNITSSTIEPGGAQEIEVIFTPDEVGLFEGTLSIISNDPNYPTVEIQLQGEGYLYAPSISVQPISIEFDTTLIYETSTAVLTISNIGIAVLNVTDIISSDPVFTANLTTFNVEPNQSYEVIISFTPTEQMQYNAVLSIESNDPVNNPFEVTLSGYGDIDTRIANIQSTDQVILYPNPVKDVLYIEGAKDKIIQVYDFTGILMKEVICYENKIEINIADLSGGIYSIKVQGINDTITKKIIVVR